MTTATLNPCTAKQAAFLEKIVLSRDVPPDVRSASITALAGGLSFQDCSAAIERGLKFPFSAKSTPAEQGYYLVDGAVFAVVVGKESGKLYAKKLIVVGKKGSWVYAPGAVYTLRAEQKITLAEAVSLGHTLGCCVICGRTLSDAKSVAAGIGPVCAKKI
jgi:hypothetical protein